MYATETSQPGPGLANFLPFPPIMSATPGGGYKIPISQMRKWRLREAICSDDRAKISTDGFYWSAGGEVGCLEESTLEVLDSPTWRHFQRSGNTGCAGASGQPLGGSREGQLLPAWEGPSRGREGLRVSGAPRGLGPILHLQERTRGCGSCPSEIQKQRAPGREGPRGPL